LSPLRQTISNQHILLSSERCIFWEEESILILTDLHVGKSSHFRKAGIPIPQQVFQDDLNRLLQEITYFNPKKILITGDLFHSVENMEHMAFAVWMKSFSAQEVILIRGNHEILTNADYEKLGLVVFEKEFTVGPFTFAHELPFEKKLGQYYFTGHLHPGVQISGRGKQVITMPCFYFAKDYCVLPAFSKFTGLFIVDSKRGEKVFAIIGAEQSVIPLDGDLS
jgi:DNA ligase-associated metallophosphoesterase